MPESVPFLKNIDEPHKLSFYKLNERLRFNVNWLKNLNSMRF